MSIKSSLINFFGNIKIYKGGIVFFGEAPYKVKGPDMREVLDLIQPGDIVINRKDHYVSNMFIKGDFSHVGLYVGNNDVIHVMSRGIRKEDILVFLRADALALVRPLDQSKVESAIIKAYDKFREGAMYDYDFDKDCPEEFYCSEFTDYCYDYTLRDSFSKNFIYPDDYINSSKYHKIIWIKR
jgi:hypothetical protein